MSVDLSLESSEVLLGLSDLLGEKLASGDLVRLYSLHRCITLSINSSPLPRRPAHRSITLALDRRPLS